MSDKDGNDKLGGGAGKGWTDKERLTYLFALIENSNVKFDYNNTPRPSTRTLVACRLMITRLKATLKHELAALKKQGGDDYDNNNIKKNKKRASIGTRTTKATSGRKRKGVMSDDDDLDGMDGMEEEEETPCKRGRGRGQNKKKVKVEDDEDEDTVKLEFANDDDLDAAGDFE